MKQTLLMERVGNQTRLAVIEDGALCELYHERPGIESVSGNIYAGRVENVLPGMNAAFVDIGTQKNGFLAAGDARLFAQGDRELSTALGKARIEQLARPGQTLLVQAVKAATGQKGPRLSCHIAIPGRLMVLLCGVSYVGISRKTEDASERERLRGLGNALTAGTGHGLILRTSAQGTDEASLKAEFDRLCALYEDLRNRAAHAATPKRLYDDNALTLRAVRDMLNDDVDALWTDDAAVYEALMACANAIAPRYADRIRLHADGTPLFDLYRVDAQIDKALRRQVWLDGGGSLVIQETEALTAVDVNTGKNTGGRDADDTILRTNLEAARALVRQLRLRDIGGIVIADFINMKRDVDRQALMDVLREEAARDRGRTVVVDITPLGLVELTRKRARDSLSRQLTHTCPICGGDGVVPSHESVARRAARALWRRRRGGDTSALVLEAAPPVCARLRAIGLPGGGPVALRPREDMDEGEFRLNLAKGDMLK